MRPSFFSSSSSSPSTTTTTTTTTTNNASPSSAIKPYNSKNGRPGCLSGVLRRLLCLNKQSTHPCDHFKEEEKQPLVSHELRCVEEVDYPDELNTPGVVARLMGLESKPNIMERSSKSIGRSQSMNSIQSLKALKSTNNRHVKSFREIPSYRELEDKSFFIISFDKAGEIWQGMKSDVYSVEKKQRKKAICKRNSREIQQEHNKENQDANKVSKSQKKCNLIGSEKIYPDCKVNGLDSSCRKSYLVYELVDSHPRARRSRRKKAKPEVGKMGTGPDSKDSSPNSVHDFAGFPPKTNLEAPDSGKVSRLENSKSRRTLSEELKNCRETEKRRLTRDDYDPRRSKDKWDEACQLVERETLQSNWIFKEILKEADEFQEIGRYLGLQILDQLFAELLNNLLDLPPYYS